MATEILTVTTTAVTKAGERVTFPYPMGSRAGDYSSSGAVLKVDGAVRPVGIGISFDRDGAVVTPSASNEIPAGTLTLEVSYTPANEPAEFVRLPNSSVSRELGEVLGSVLRRPQVVATSGAIPSNATGGGGANNYTRGDYRQQIKFGPSAVSDLQLIFGNWACESAAAETPGANNIYIEASLELYGTTLRINFNGQKKGLIEPGASIISDALGVDIPASATGILRWSVSVTNAGETWPTVSYWKATNADDYILSAAATSQVDATGSLVIPSGGVRSPGFAFPVMAVIGLPEVPFRAVARIGDSIDQGAGENNSAGDNNGNYSYIGRGLAAVSSGAVPNIRLSRSSETAANFSGIGGYRRRGLLQYCTDAIIEYGTNDLGSATTAEQLQGYLSTIIASVKRRGLTAWLTQVLIRTGSGTNTPITINNFQTKRSAMMAWNHQQVGAGVVAGVIDANPYLEDPAAPGAWLPGLLPADGLHPTAAGHAAAAPAVTAAFS